MTLTQRELWAVVHGMGLGAIFLLAFAGGFAGLWSLRTEYITPAGLRERIRRLDWGTSVMAAAAWLTVISGTWIVYPWYRAKPPEGATDLSVYPRSLILASEATARWHDFGMEWKEHVAWLAPFLATAVAYVVWRYGDQIAANDPLRRVLIVLFTLAFLTAAAAGLFGAFITKVAPIY